MEKKTSTEEITLTMQEALVEFKKIWKNIIKTGNYDIYIEKLSLHLTTFKKLDLRTQEDLQYFQFALIFANFVMKIRSDKDLKETLEKISNVQ